MRFFTPLTPIEFNHKIDFNARICALGSCFAQTIGDRLNYYKWATTINPFGVIFHPLAIEAMVERAVHHRVFTQDDLYHFGDTYHALEVHSTFMGDSPETLLTDLNGQLDLLRTGLLEASHLLITYGTAYGYRLKSTDQVVGNCHKLPQTLFDKYLLSPEELQSSMEQTLVLLNQINPHAQVIFTVSPVRHLKDGVVENGRSKAQLISSVHQVVAKDSNTVYFPAYELMMDVLRDYRFYEKDMIHPNDQAKDVIWEHFCKAAIDDALTPMMKAIDGIQKAMAHRPQHINSAEHQAFLAQLAQSIQDFQKRYPHIQF